MKNSLTAKVLKVIGVFFGGGGISGFCVVGSMLNFVMWLCVTRVGVF